jgi:hypothetical protein
MKKEIGKILTILIILPLVGCSRSAKDDKKAIAFSNDSNNINFSTKAKQLFPKDTLNFLNYDELVSLIQMDKNVIPEILNYTLSSEIWIFRNEMFARKGFKFKNEFLKTYFSYKDWYHPGVSSTDSIHFSSLEKLLLDSLVTFEKRNKSLTIKSLQNELKRILLNHIDTLPITLWKHLVGQYPRSTNLGVAPWDFLGNAYHLQYSDTTLGFYQCIVSFYCGAEGPGCSNATLYNLDENLHLVGEVDLESGLDNIKKINKSEYSFSTMVNVDEDNWKEIKGKYKILKSGKIEIKYNK